MVAHNAVEDHHRAIFAAFGRGDCFLRVDAIAGECNSDILPVSTHIQRIRRPRRTAAGDRWQQAHLVPVVQNVLGLRVFGIHAYRDAAQNLSRGAGRQWAAQALQQHGH